MKKIGNITGTQIREMADLYINRLDNDEPSQLYFVQLDDLRAVANDGSIWQIVNKEDCQLLAYKGEDCYYNYAEDNADFAEDSEDFEIYSHCLQQCELLFEEN